MIFRWICYYMFNPSTYLYCYQGDKSIWLGMSFRVLDIRLRSNQLKASVILECEDAVKERLHRSGIPTFE